MSKIKDIAEKLAEQVAEELSLSIYDVEYKKDGADWRLTYYIDKDSGVSLKDCEEFSRKISEILDERDPIDQNYILTVSSPGIERKLSKLKHFQAAVGKKAEFKLYAAKYGAKSFCGIILNADEEKVTLKFEDKDLDFEYKEISAAKTVYEF